MAIVLIAVATALVAVAILIAIAKGIREAHDDSDSMPSGWTVVIGIVLLAAVTFLGYGFEYTWTLANRPTTSERAP
jgi:uncharacterized membrane protein YcjF (UPF0283 family)